MTTQIPSVLDFASSRECDRNLRMSAIMEANTIPDGEVRMLGTLLLEKSGGRWTEYVFGGTSEFAKGTGSERVADLLVKWMAEQPELSKELYRSMGPAFPEVLTQRGAIHKALARQIAKGEYRHSAALRLWRKAVTSAARRWAGGAISPVTRDLAATKLADEFVMKAREGAFDHHLPLSSPVRSLLVKAEDVVKANPEGKREQARWAKEIERAKPLPADLGLGKPTGEWTWSWWGRDGRTELGNWQRKYEHGEVWIEALGSTKSSTGPFLISTGDHAGGAGAKRFKGPATGTFRAAMAHVDGLGAGGSRPKDDPATKPAAASGGQKPPGSGWQSIPNGKKGGFRRKAGSGWEYWYPGHGLRKSRLEVDDAIAAFQRPEFPTIQAGSVTYAQRAATPMPLERSRPGLRPRPHDEPIALRGEAPRGVVRSGPDGRLMDPRTGLRRK